MHLVLFSGDSPQASDGVVSVVGLETVFEEVATTPWGAAWISKSLGS